MSSPFISFDPFIFSQDFMLFNIMFLFMVFMFFWQNSFVMLAQLFYNQLKNLFPSTEFKSKGLEAVLFGIFFYIFLVNIFSLWSYVFSLTAHIIFSFTLALIFWLAIMSKQLIDFYSRKAEHFVPDGTPTWLLPLMVMIEIVSQLIRPITLSVRLAANLTAGHLILSLLASSSVISSLFVQLPLLILELLVALVQPFVFTMLTLLYFSEN